MPDLSLDICVEKLAKQHVNQYLKLDAHQEIKLTQTEINFLLRKSSILSLSNDSNEVSLAYDICSGLIEIYGGGDPVLGPSADLILSRIGNFPGRKLLRSKYLGDEQPYVPFPLAIERLARETENSISNEQILTDFQYKLFAALDVEKSLSVSAPTSAGKSHVLNLDLVRRLQNEKSPCIVYVVPTRALVSEVVGRIRTAIRTTLEEGIVVRTAPFPVHEKNEVKGIVYVLTQERLLRLLTFVPQGVKITTLIVDEAHEIQKGKRGILLQNAVDSAIKKFPEISILFASPLIKNPGYLLQTFGRSRNGRFFTEKISPVSQNVILVSEVFRKPRKVFVELVAQQETIAIGTAEVNFSFRGSKTEQMGRFAVQICNPGESAILFSNDASDAEDSATTIAECIDNFEVTDEISDFINFIRSEIHPEYPLIECLRKGVAFHYGNMPSIIRSTVERFFKNGQIRYLCSTSTLLQGVNLPAKHIVIQDPLLGTQKMGRADFRNLAGRAGRLLKEFHGNVWCLRPGDWNNQCYKGEDLQEIRGAMDDVMLDGGTLIGSISEGLDVGAAGELGDAAFARLYHEIKEAGAAETFSTYQSEENEYLLRANIAQLDALKIDIPSEILEAHRSLRPDLLQNLLNKLRDLHSLENAVLINPHESGGKERMIFALSMINDAFATPMLDKYLNWVSTTAHNWVWGTPIGEMLSGRVNFSRKGEPDAKASPIIRALLRLIENEIRYKMVKNFAAYEDLLKLAWFEREGVEHNGIAPYHVYLEFGSSDPASLSLMALGLSRFTAIKLKNSISWNEEHEPEDYLRRLSEIGIKNLRIPLLCKIELLELLGTE